MARIDFKPLSKPGVRRILRDPDLFKHGSLFAPGPVGAENMSQFEYRCLGSPE
jgi:hypothetical protein